MVLKKCLLLVIGIAVVALLALPARAEILDIEDDLDLSGNIVKAVNFCDVTDTADRVIDGVTFTGMSKGVTLDGVSNNANADYQVCGGNARWGPPVIDILGSSIYQATGGTMDITVTGLTPGAPYKMQLLLYEGWGGGAGTGRQADISVNGSLIVDDYDFWTAQGSNFYGGRVTYTDVADGSGNFVISSVATLVGGTHTGGLIMSTGNGVDVGAAAVVDVVDEVRDLDLSNNVKAINFGDTFYDRKIEGVTFLPAILGTTVDGITNNAPMDIYCGQYSSVRADIPLEQIDGSLIAATGGADLNVDVTLDSGYFYDVQLIMTEIWGNGDPDFGRTVDVYMEGSLVADDYDYGAEQGGLYASSVFKTTVAVTDGNLDIDLIDSNYDSLISGMVITKGAEIPEPSTVVLLVCGLLGLLACRRR